MKMRKITSLTALLSFLITVLTSIVLYIVPHGRVAYWADWQLWGLSKEQWGAIHINVGFLFLLSIIFHIFYNWKPIISYLKNQSKQIKICTKEFNVALFFSLFCVIGTYIEIPPFSIIIEFGDHIKEEGTKRYGEPPYGHAELSSLQSFAKKMDLDLQKSMRLLQKAGYAVDNRKQSIKDVALRNNVSPRDIYNVIKDAYDEAESSSILPDAPPTGTGNMLLSELCERYNLDIPLIANSLKEKNISSQGDMTIKHIAEDNGISPQDLYYMIKSIAPK